MTESEILSAIESLDCWLQLKKSDFFEENFLKLRNLLVGKANPCCLMVEIADLREDIKKKLYSFLVRNTDFGEDNNEKLHNFLVGIADFRDDNMMKLCTLLIDMEDFSLDQKDLLRNLPRRFLEEYKENLYSSLVRMAKFRLNKENMHILLVEMVDFLEDNKEKLYSLLVWVAVLADSSLYKNKRIVTKKKSVYSLLVEMTELWEDDDNGKMNKEKLHPLLLEITDLTIDECTKEIYYRNLNKQKLCSLVADIAGLWKSIKGKLNMVKVYSWLAKKADLWEQSHQLFRLLLDVAFHHENKGAEFSIRNTVKGIKGELRSILDFLRDKKWEEGSSLHCFVSDAVEMAREAQLLIGLRDSDPFIIFHIFNREDDAFINGERNLFDDKVLDIWNWIKETKERMLECGVERAITKLENAGKGGDSTIVVGLEEDIKLLLGLKNKHTIFIAGMAGIGKTTLARRLYDHATIVDEYECRAWVCVSWELSRKEILIKLIQQLVYSKEFERDVGNLEKMDNKGLKQMLNQYLKGKRYFIVLDNVWEKTLMGYVTKALPKDEESRLVMTTRITDLNFIYNDNTDYAHCVKYLDDYESWQLFLKTIFFGTSGQEFPKELEKRGRKMLTRCNGVPSAIKEMGRRWAKKNQSEWEELVESTNLDDTLAALEPTYYNLDPQVKSCFLLLSFFEEGTSISWKKMEDIWMVGGVRSKKDLSPLEIMTALEFASIFVETPTNGRKTCRVNAVFHMLSIIKAEDEIGLEILGKDGNNRVCDNPRHRVIYCNREKFTYSTNQNNDHGLVSLFFRGGGYFDASPSYWTHFEQLEILDMENIGLKILPDEVGKLPELRYLGLRNNYIRELPNSLGQLEKLEVLDIALNFMMEMPDVIWGISSLHHLYMSDVNFQKPMKIDALKNLQILTYISVDDWVCKLLGLEILSGLRKLGIEELDGDSDVGKLFASLAKLKYLHHLTLRGFRYRSMPLLDETRNLQMLNELKLEGRLERLPSAKNFPPNIRYLSLVNSCLDEDPMPILEDIPYLLYLKLQNAYNGQQMVVSSNGFRHVNHLVVEELWNLRKIEVRKGGMGAVEKLDIKSCPYLETLPCKDIMRKKHECNLFDMVTTKHIAKKILESDIIPEKCISNIQP